MNFLETIIDGYNFLMTTGLMDTNVTDIELEKGRRRLIQLLVKSFPEPEDRSKLTIVFDSATLLDLPVASNVQGINVRFSKGYDSADEQIMEMIRANAVPKRLLVVSSDHEIQTCASRRKASFIDSDQWLDELESKMARDRNPESGNEANDHAKTEIKDSAYWMDVFSDVDVSEVENSDVENSEVENSDESLLEPNTSTSDSDPANPSKPPESTEKGSKKKSSKKDDENLEGWDELFPPGYGEDLLE